MIPRTIYLREILIVEGYLALWYPRLRSLYTRTYYLDIDEKISLKRRKKFDDPTYDKKVLIPMHKKFVEPTKKFADIVLDVSKMKLDQVFKEIDQDLNQQSL